MDIDIERLKWDAKYWDEVAEVGAIGYCHRYRVWQHRKPDHPCRLCIPRPTKPAAPEWVNGLPPVGCECEATWLEPPDGGDRDYERVLIKGYWHDEKSNIGQVWFSAYRSPLSRTPSNELIRRPDDCSFRPIRTQADRDRDYLAGELYRFVESSKNKMGTMDMVKLMLAKYEVQEKDEC